MKSIPVSPITFSSWKVSHVRYVPKVLYHSLPGGGSVVLGSENVDDVSPKGFTNV